MTGIAKIRELMSGLKGPEEDFGELSDDIEVRLGLIDDELMKRGTLASSTMDAGEIIDNSTSVLGSCTHLAAFRGLVIALPIAEINHGVEAALHVATTLFGTHWPDLHPQGKKHLRRRNAWAKDIVTALEQSVERARKRDGDLSPSCHSTLAEFLKLGETAGIDLGKLAKLAERSADEAENVTSKGQETDADPAAVRLDARGRADLRREIKAISERISLLDPTEAVAYQLRGFAAWLEYRILPDADKEGVTQVQSMPAFIVDEFSKGLANPTLAVLTKLEDRLFMSPDWFEGQKMAWEIAVKLGLDSIAEAVHGRTHARLQAFPGLKNLRYSNGKKLVPPEVDTWLEQPVNQTTEVETGIQGLEDRDLGLEALLAEFNTKLSTTASPRSRAVVKLDIAKAFHSAGLKSQAAMMFGEIKEQMIAANVDKWDADLFAEVLQWT